MRLHHEITSRQAVGLVAAYLDGALDEAARRRFETHLAECKNCVEHLKQIRAAIGWADRVREEDLSPTARADLLMLYRRRRAEEGRQA